jgi:hypothetical protein
MVNDEMWMETPRHFAIARQPSPASCRSDAAVDRRRRSALRDDYNGPLG